MERSAHISDCGQYRYRLRRKWGNKGFGPLFVMLNPSTADAEVDDATIRRCIGLTQGWGCEQFDVVNLFAYRATDPKALLKARDPIGPINDECILDAAAHSDFIVCAWGAAKIAESRGRKVLRLLQHKTPHCLAVTKSGAPKHPLYIKAGTKPAPYPPRPTPTEDT